MQKIKFTDPQTNEVVEFAVEEETTLNGTRYRFSFRRRRKRRL